MRFPNRNHDFCSVHVQSALQPHRLVLTKPYLVLLRQDLKHCPEWEGAPRAPLQVRGTLEGRIYSLRLPLACT